jgi:hypothetical protein
MGVTSRGVFITNAAEQVVFVSFEGWRGPLTVNLGKKPIPPAPFPEGKGGQITEGKPISTEIGFPSGSPSLQGRGRGRGSSAPLAFLGRGAGGEGKLQSSQSFPEASENPASYFSQVEHGDPVILESGHVLFPKADILVDAENLPGWQAELRVESLELPMIERLRAVAQHVVVVAEGKGWTALLARWLNPDHPAELASFLVPIEQSLIHLRRALKAGNIQEISSLLTKITGRGSGLTPSGDDVIIGLLLMLSVVTGEDSVLFNTQYAIRNTSSTTRLSIALISAAAQGQADERLITALDGILTGNLPEIDCAELLLAYGSSSGGDTLLGMTLVV